MAEPFPHGQPRGYRRGCRQACCRGAYKRQRAARSAMTGRGVSYLVPIDTALAQYRELRAAGFTARYLADRLGYPNQGAPPFTMRRPTRITTATAARMAALYVELRRSDTNPQAA